MSRAMIGSAMKPSTSETRVMPSWAPERWNDSRFRSPSAVRGRSAPRRGPLLDPVAVGGHQPELGRDEHRTGQDQEADGEQAECGVDWWSPMGRRERAHRTNAPGLSEPSPPTDRGGHPDHPLPLADREMVRHTNHVSLEPSPTRIAVDGVHALARLAKAAEIALGSVDLSLPQYRVLVFLSEHDAAAASALASRLDVTRPTITAIVDGLVARGLVERRAARTDRRRVEHHLTVAGEQLLAAGDDAVVVRLGAIAGHLAPDQADEAATGLIRWGEGLNRARTAYWSGAADPAVTGPAVTSDTAVTS